MNKLFSIVLMVISVLFSANAVEKTPLKSTALLPSQAVNASGIWIDVRTPQEFAEGHLQNAVNIPYDQIVAKIAQVSPNKNELINLYCRSGRRAEIALAELKMLGYTKITNHGSYQELVKKGVR